MSSRLSVQRGLLSVPVGPFSVRVGRDSSLLDATPGASSPCGQPSTSTPDLLTDDGAKERCSPLITWPAQGWLAPPRHVEPVRPGGADRDLGEGGSGAGAQKGAAGLIPLTVPEVRKLLLRLVGTQLTRPSRRWPGRNGGGTSTGRGPATTASRRRNHLPGNCGCETRRSPQPRHLDDREDDVPGCVELTLSLLARARIASLDQPTFFQQREGAIGLLWAYPALVLPVTRPLAKPHVPVPLHAEPRAADPTREVPVDDLAEVDLGYGFRPFFFTLPFRRSILYTVAKFRLRLSLISLIDLPSTCSDKMVC